MHTLSFPGWLSSSNFFMFRNEYSRVPVDLRLSFDSTHKNLSFANSTLEMIAYVCPYIGQMFLTTNWLLGMTAHEADRPELLWADLWYIWILESLHKLQWRFRNFESQIVTWFLWKFVIHQLNPWNNYLCEADRPKLLWAMLHSICKFEYMWQIWDFFDPHVTVQFCSSHII